MDALQSLGLAALIATERFVLLRISGPR